VAGRHGDAVLLRDGRAVGLTTMTGGPGYYCVTEIGDPGSYQVRVCRRSGDDAGNRWLVQFWPDDHVRPPRWLVRRPRTTPGWTYQVTDPATLIPDVYALVSWSPDATVVTTVTDLSRRLLLDEEIITRTLRAPDRYLQVTGSPDDVRAPHDHDHDPMSDQRPDPRGRDARSSCPVLMRTAGLDLHEQGDVWLSTPVTLRDLWALGRF
jgi:hypothetical protein